MIRKMRKFRQFTNHDWDCYASCDSDNPLISETEVKVELDGYTYFGSIIVDDFFISIQMVCELDKSNKGINIDGKLDHKILVEEMAADLECMAKSFARSFAESIPATVDAEWLFLNGFKLS